MGRPEVWLSRLSYALGSERHHLSECADHLLTAPQDLLDAGFAHHHRCPPGQSALDLAREAIAAGAAVLGHAAPLEPQALLHVTALPQGANVGDPQTYERTRDVKHLMDFPAGRLQSELGWYDAAVLGLTQQACTGLLGGWRVASALLAAEPDWQQIAVISADRFPEGARYEQAYQPISDAATFSLASRTPSPGAFRLRVVHQITNGAMSLAGDTQTAGSFFPWMHRTITATLERAGITGDDLFAVVPQNTHRATWQVLSSLLGWKVPVHEATRAGLGHLISGDGVANLCDLATTTEVPPGALLLLTAAGYGATWQCAVLEAGPK